MNRTFTPLLPHGVLPRLEADADLFRSDFPMSRQADWSLVYLRGLLQDGERKSIEPLVEETLVSLTLPGSRSLWKDRATSYLGQ